MPAIPGVDCRPVFALFGTKMELRALFTLAQEKCTWETPWGVWGSLNKIAFIRNGVVQDNLAALEQELERLARSRKPMPVDQSAVKGYVFVVSMEFVQRHRLHICGVVVVDFAQRVHIGLESKLIHFARQFQSHFTIDHKDIFIELTDLFNVFLISCDRVSLQIKVCEGFCLSIKSDLVDFCVFHLLTTICEYYA